MYQTTDKIINEKLHCHELMAQIMDKVVQLDQELAIIYANDENWDAALASIGDAQVAAENRDLFLTAAER